MTYGVAKCAHCNRPFLKRHEIAGEHYGHCEICGARDSRYG